MYPVQIKTKHIESIYVNVLLLPISLLPLGFDNTFLWFYGGADVKLNSAQASLLILYLPANWNVLHIQHNVSPKKPEHLLILLVT